MVRLTALTALSRPRTLFARMWHSLLLIMLATFVVHAFLVMGTLQLGSEAQTQRRLERIGEHWSTQAPLAEPLGLDPVTVIYPRHDLLPSNIQRMLPADSRGIFELGNRAEDYFVLARSRSVGPAFYVVEFHSEVKPNETMEHQVFIWYLMGMVPLCLVLLWLCQRITARVAAPMREVGRQVVARSPGSLEPLALPPGSPVELEALVGQINSALQRTADLLDRERSFTRFASHELRTPAAVVQSALERIEAHANPEQERPIARARRGLRDMHALIDTFLQLSTHSDKAPAAAPVSIDREWVAALIRHVTGGSTGRAFTIEVQRPLVLAAPATMVHVLMANLLKNAMFHGGPEPIDVVISADAFEVRNSLLDKPSPSGFGLGCQIAHRICARCGWSFTLTMTDGVATARVTTQPLPADKSSRLEG
jgi:signal transduction histidine kinase